MATSTTLGVKLDEATRDRLKEAARRIERTPHWLIKQAIFSYLEALESGMTLPELQGIAQRLAEGDHDALEALPESTHQPFLEFAESILPQSVLRAAITAAYRRPEQEAVPMLLEQARLPAEMSDAAYKLAYGIAEKLRNQKSAGGRAGIVQGLLQEFSLSSQEGVALMCLAEALLRIPDKGTRDALIRDKISTGNWQQHLGQSPSMFVNAASWGLLITGKLVSTHNEAGLSSSLNRIIGKSGEPVIRKGVDMAMRLMGEQFVTGETIAEALANATNFEAKGFRYSYDMLGEAALTEEDAQRYYASYEQAIHAIGKASHGRGIYEGPGISIKLSALHPRYSRAQYERMMGELYPRLLSLTLLAKQYDIGLNIDAEEADRLEISLDLLERLCFEPSLKGWNGIGFVIQAYQKRCPYVIDYVIDLARRSQHRLMIRLVKGAYWDSEIKRAQVDGLEGFPVYSRKVYTDISYIACARKLLGVPDAIYPQFATHNAHTLSAIYQIAGQNYYPGQYEFQCLHGMGEPLYEQVVGKVADGKLNRPCRIYAPVGTHETLLAYLVRRLLENGANTSFVNRIADHSISIKDLVEDPVTSAESMASVEGALGLPHPRIPQPKALYGEARVNSSGIDMANEHRLASLSSALLSSGHADWRAQPMLGCPTSEGVAEPVLNPADHRDVVGHVQNATTADVGNAVLASITAAPIWQSTPPVERAAALDRAADLMESEMQSLMGILVREAGKTFANAIAEVREAVDFLRYYAAQARHDFANDTHRPLGPVVCISPWNFPLAIFAGQVAAALAAGNTVLAKPAEQTPLIAAQAVRIMLQAGIPEGVVQLLPGLGHTVGAALVSDERVKGVMFTGSTEVAGILARNVAGRLDAQGRPIPLIAETGGQNAMIVDSSALAEQVVTDVIASAFDSAGQRCSALRVLCVQEDVADRVVEMLKGAMAECRIGNPEHLNVDIGPVIDAEAKANIDKHIQAMRSKGRSVFQIARTEGDVMQRGTFVMPTLIELDSLADLEREIFGPVLHLLRYKREDMDALLDEINATGYGLTLGVHTRIDETIAKVVDKAHAGNLYVNRNMVGAVVGVQPFGGEGLSGTGPKAGGPLYMYRLLATRPADGVSRTFQRLDGQNVADTQQRNTLQDRQGNPLEALKAWAAKNGKDGLANVCDSFAEQSQSGLSRVLPGPTGERNTYVLLPREAVLCLADDETDLLTQLAATLAVGSSALWATSELTGKLRAALPKAVQARIQLVADWTQSEVVFDAVLHHGDSDQLGTVCRQVASRKGPIIGVQGLSRGETAVPLERLLIERAISVNTAAAGGNASLMTIG
ncbi:trifunctional transcriptional regulator/proline dehydrogenase/L-glutamate gamma-semialdehyde dehydrogenase [Pseudomonas sp. JS3066]|jgi:RHH-type proline utilization regulon transcriptional repressor/proline dehydrogenase/delta 1-pyrroline-5-carboxylate dehydrogenase|uniref:trifunctional transcriptional regulator/proline dehydrogenase/L-glutamate gamma-semialdehyde dehydrogenase n=1 Tax=unclassified Pseudomonas TaxID=196821 RepID=UPI000EAA1F6C|nr:MULTISPECIES: trifunctional transcriptional regulator/proline dehydrogenase/L-glutamate gamma-semialdehyde dehydrogenase [unclassified Pseudomonas]AYF87507.1 trifunctional transcriptional regulator/proline dehydrogenase/L-glutamate gamma-semialdehyde dehydrogenase [Pseudomonas sp. DY-1]MDH4651472.1 trifunctional transcriptional regulator/proline dehydrogenase/L-glutamate gamma-semialdehyde dehydrogenase [Pseudomonas sp. BN606]MRK19183.1 trifunctional transcriptional regulator/proline dehydrog